MTPLDERDPSHNASLDGGLIMPASKTHRLPPASSLTPAAISRRELLAGAGATAAAFALE